MSYTKCQARINIVLPRYDTVGTPQYGCGATETAGAATERQSVIVNDDVVLPGSHPAKHCFAQEPSHQSPLAGDSQTLQ